MCGENKYRNFEICSFYNVNLKITEQYKEKVDYGI